MRTPIADKTMKITIDLAIDAAGLGTVALEETFEKLREIGEVTLVDVVIVPAPKTKKHGMFQTGRPKTKP